MDFSNLLHAMSEGNESTLGEMLEHLTPILKKYLMAKFSAEEVDAEDAIQTMLLKTLIKARNDKIKNPDAFLGYIYSATRNEYLKIARKKLASGEDSLARIEGDFPGQLEKLLDEEKMRILEHCLQTLKSAHQSYIAYWFENPGEEASKVAEKFKISVNNAWTKKHRIIRMLNECYQAQSNL